MQTAFAIIPARGGSKSITDKNIVSLAGHPLIAYSIAAAKLTVGISRIIVSTDSERYAEIARSYGAEVPFLRPSELASDNATDIGFMLHAMKWFDQNEQKKPELWVHLRPTTPLREPKHIQEAINLIRSTPDATSLRSAYPCASSPYKWFRHNKEGYFHSIISEDTDLDKLNFPRQHYPKVFVPDGYVDIVRHSFVTETQTLHGNKVVGFISPVCTEIDSKEELRRLEFDIAMDGSKLLDYLNQVE